MSIKIKKYGVSIAFWLLCKKTVLKKTLKNQSLCYCTLYLSILKRITFQKQQLYFLNRIIYTLNIIIIRDTHTRIRWRCYVIFFMKFFQTFASKESNVNTIANIIRVLNVLKFQLKKKKCNLLPKLGPRGSGQPHFRKTTIACILLIYFTSKQTKCTAMCI